ncbi:N-acetyltransferase [Flavobacterium rhamnosiphilum]|uniref:N-acetyltransferase n=1 Tax=Flavobacterium rhamnosiphilum TaxID=2541724 RepID=A0A4R5F642_9FLAO|nr:GNAT family N-acetyltransferase [Flavobacterium rhamnosiphilum]TDE43213.1 N-acetyltransferase [Flavobacterium rhamnosiphilum]
MDEIELTYRKCLNTDIEYLLWLRKKTMNEHLIYSGIDISHENHLKRIMFQFEQAKIILLKDQKIGLLKILEQQSNIEIIQIQIEPLYQGKGIGQKIIKSVIEKLSDEKLSVTLSVLKENKAKKLYDSIGFKVISENNESFIMKYEKT